ncbi:alcohol dehydrogenase domain, GroES family protein [Medicago truncatula]|uniref:Alcohol dehydrogenase domain, GroES family protein n=1 Tax=Medicago truncatula TaxID=3880 RepID=G7KGJ1_MEDTR|nr:alcohol dehydrogenase domain, GroES family protein [Medicago truncatula]
MKSSIKTQSFPTLINEDDDVGSKVVKFKIEDRVSVGCFVDSCQSCQNCANNLESYFPGYKKFDLVVTDKTRHYRLILSAICHNYIYGQPYLQCIYTQRMNGNGILSVCRC